MSQVPDWFVHHHTQSPGEKECELVQHLHDSQTRLDHSSPWPIDASSSTHFYPSTMFTNYNWPATSSGTIVHSYNSDGNHRLMPVLPFVSPSSVPSNQPQQLQPQEHQLAFAGNANEQKIMNKPAVVHSESNSCEQVVPLDLSLGQRYMSEQHQCHGVSINPRPSSMFNLLSRFQNYNWPAICSAMTNLYSLAGSPRPLPVWPYVLPSSIQSDQPPIAPLLYQQAQWPTQRPLDCQPDDLNCGQQGTQTNQVTVTDSGHQATLVQSHPILSMVAVCPWPPLQQQQLDLLVNVHQPNMIHEVAEVHSESESSEEDVPLDLNVDQRNKNEQSQHQSAHQLPTNALAINMQQQQQRAPQRRPPVFTPMFGEIRCVSCRIVFRRSENMRIHLERRHPRLFARCGKLGCRRAFPSFIFLMEHYDNVHPDELIKFRCRFCDANFNSPVDLTNHFLYYHHRGRFYCTHEGCYFVAEYQNQVQQHYYANHVRHTIANHLAN